ncbi:hypothetical protein BKI52_29310 [marine bacterium AO1-C]|nr:hypothetical protein BKI52_29310 [marine bacterium AO1-C]
MNRFMLLSICIGVWLFLLSCGGSSNESTQKDSIESSNFQTVDNIETTEADENSIANKIFTLNNNRQDCNAQTFSKEWSTMKFNPDGTVSSISAAAKNTGGNDFYELRQTSFGAYTRKDEVITIEFIKTKSEKIKEGKVLDTSDQDAKMNWVLKVTKCADGRLQLVSNMPNKNAQGKSNNGKDQSSWVATR